jgi:hypothetical protein
MFASRIPTLRKIAYAVLLAAVGAKAHAGALADGFAIAGELYAASLVGGSMHAPRPPRAEPAVPDPLVAPGERASDRAKAQGVQGYECRGKGRHVRLDTTAGALTPSRGSTTDGVP